jgi:hypothetical protein
MRQNYTITIFLVSENIRFERKSSDLGGWMFMIYVIFGFELHCHVLNNEVKGLTIYCNIL